MDLWPSRHALRQPHGSWWTSRCTSRACRWASVAEPHVPETQLQPLNGKLRCCCRCIVLAVKHVKQNSLCASYCLHKIKLPVSHVCDALATFSSMASLLSVLIQDALFAAAEPEPAVSDLSEHERQRPPSPAAEQPLHPHQYQLQHAGQRLPQQQGSEAPVPR